MGTLDLHTAVVVVTGGRVPLLARTLEFIGGYANLGLSVEVLVVENGGEPRARPTCEHRRSDIPLRYFFLPETGKSRGLNFALQRTEASLICFHDDDIRTTDSTLSDYVDAATRYGRGHFFGGPLGIDYERPPPEWLKRYLPPSAVGWNPGEEERYHDAPDFLGANWAAFREDLLRVGGFTTHLGPTERYRALGEEAEIQERLLRAGCRGVYLPGARVWHYVPAERCTLAWARKRRYQSFLTRTLRDDSPAEGPTIGGVPRWLWRECVENALGVLWRRLSGRSERRRAVSEMKLAQSWGRTMGHRHRSRLENLSRADS